VTTAPPSGPQVKDRRAAETSLAYNRGEVGDQVFKGLSVGSGGLILVILGLVALFLILQAMPALVNDGSLPYGNGEFWPYVLPFVFGTLWSSALALLLAVPVSIGIALFISHYAPRRIAAGLGYVIDLLAAVPSVVFGLWGINTLAPALQPLYAWLTQNLGWIPLFAGPASGTGRTMMTAAIVLAVMILPIITSLTREVFLQTPPLQEQASLALGATRWEMIRQVVFPFGRSGIMSAAMLGLGRALGETMAVAMVLSGAGVISFKLLTSENPNTIAANIALAFPEAYDLGVNELIATGLILFGITLGVNMLARYIIGRQTAKAEKSSGKKKRA
jgi:phosphate transport system permease protein